MKTPNLFNRTKALFAAALALAGGTGRATPRTGDWNRWLFPAGVRDIRGSLTPKQWLAAWFEGVGFEPRPAGRLPATRGTSFDPYARAERKRAAQRKRVGPSYAKQLRKQHREFARAVAIVQEDYSVAGQ